MYSRENYRRILCARQKPLTDGAYAEELGISRQTWQGIRTQKIPLSDRVVVNSVKLFPPYWLLAAEVILGKHHYTVYSLLLRKVRNLLQKEAQHDTYQEAQGQSLDQHEGGGNS